MTEEQINKLPKHRKDWLHIFGNTWKPRKFDGLGCEACVYGTARGERHDPGCKWFEVEYTPEDQALNAIGVNPS